jgi:hypothetical protein
MPDLDPLRVFELVAGFEAQVPDPIEFILSDAYLGRTLYPRQATLLKLIFLRDDLLTDYDYEVVDEWTTKFRESADERGEGNNGLVVDIFERIEINKAEGRKWFREVVLPIGRRGGKGYLGALAGSYVLWNYLSLGDPQGHFGIDRDKQIATMAFAGKREQARAHQWKDLNNVIVGAPCFAPYISRVLGESFSVYAPHDFIRMLDRHDRGIGTEADMATFIIEAREATTMAARGPASAMLFFDEMAHVVRAVAKADASEVYESAVPSLDQFQQWGFLWEASSPWQRLGAFFDNYSKALQHDEDGTPSFPAIFMAQLASWDTYVDWERTADPHHRLEARPERVIPPPAHIRDAVPQVSRPIFFPALRNAVQTFDAEMQRLEAANPETFAVERRAHWASVMDAYLNPIRIAEMWKPWPTESDVLTMQHQGILSRTYRAHGDPSKSGANFGWAIAHVAGHDDRGLPHVVFDKIHAWLPGDYENHEIDYDAIADDIIVDMDAFMPNELSFDQWNSVALIQRLRKHARSANYPKRVTIYERDATGPLNWKTYETFKTALGLGLVHAPYHELADLELTFLQEAGTNKVDHPTSGPVQTKDVSDCLAICTYELIGTEIAAFLGKTLAELPVGGTAQGGLPHSGQQTETHDALSGFGKGRRRPGMPTSPARRRR